MRILFQNSNGVILYLKEDDSIAGYSSKDKVIEVISTLIKQSLEEDSLLMYDTLSKLLYSILKTYTQLLKK